MKVTINDVRAALIKTFLEHCTIDDLAEMTVISLKQDGHSVELDGSVIGYGFTIRATTECRIDDDDISSAIRDAMCELFEQNTDAITSYMSDKFDITYDPIDVDDDFVQTYFDWSRDGRLISVELEL